VATISWFGTIPGTFYPDVICIYRTGTASKIMDILLGDPYTKCVWIRLKYWPVRPYLTPIDPSSDEPIWLSAMPSACWGWLAGYGQADGRPGRPAGFISKQVTSAQHNDRVYRAARWRHRYTRSPPPRARTNYWGSQNQDVTTIEHLKSHDSRRLSHRR